MILPDINILVYAHNVRSAQYAKATRWWNECLQGPEGVALAWVVLLGFVRVTTNPRAFEHPMRAEEAIERVGEWLSLPHIYLVEPAENHFEKWSSLLKGLGTAGNLTTDAHLAALAMERGLILHTTDADFARFPGLKWHNPLR
jgi:hypothetical protein